MTRFGKFDKKSRHIPDPLPMRGTGLLAAHLPRFAGFAQDTKSAKISFFLSPASLEFSELAEKNIILLFFLFVLSAFKFYAPPAH